MAPDLVEPADPSPTCDDRPTIPSTLSTSIEDLRSRCVGLPALDARLEPWMVTFLRGQQVHDAIQQHGSPLNLLCTAPMDRNIGELCSAAHDRGVDLKVFFARKSNKAISFVDQTIRSKAAVDTASENELQQCLDRGVAAADLICTAAIKDDSLMRCCLRNNVCVSVDNLDETIALAELAKAMNIRGRIAIRLGGFEHHAKKLWTRFGFDVDDETSITQVSQTNLSIEGVHFHLDGYDPTQRVSAIGQSLQWVERLRASGHPVGFLDIGGGFPINYLEHGSQWHAFWEHLRESLCGRRDPITYRNHPLGHTVADGNVHGSPQSYPYYQTPVRQQWLESILDAKIDGVALSQRLVQLNLQLRCEPGRSLMDGCGMTVTRVEYVKTNAIGDTLVGVSMNRTQCRTSSDDFLVDPIVIAGPRVDAVHGVDAGEQATARQGYLVGAYCTESELIQLRRLSFPNGIRRGDLIVLPNTAGYLMHFLESRSHQLPLAKNIIVDMATGETEIDPIDKA